MKRRVSFEIPFDGGPDASLVLSMDEAGNIIFTVYNGEAPMLLAQETSKAVVDMVEQLIEGNNNVGPKLLTKG